PLISRRILRPSGSPSVCCGSPATAWVGLGSKSHVRFLNPTSRGSVEFAYIVLSRLASWWVNHMSERQSPGGLAALKCHCSIRNVLVNEPSYSATCADGKKKTSVLMSCGFT